MYPARFHISPLSTTSQADAYVVYTFEVGHLLFWTFVELTAGSSRVIYLRKAASQALVAEADLGSDVEIYGTIGPQAGPYTVQVDGGPSTTFNATSQYLTPQTLLYRCTGLDSVNHQFRMINAPFSGQTLSIDYAVVRRPPSCVSCLAVLREELNGSIILCRASGGSGPTLYSPRSP